MHPKNLPDSSDVGSIVGDRDLLEYLETWNISPVMANKVIHSTEEYGLGKPKELFSSEYEAGEPFIKFFIIDEGDIVKKQFIKNYPQFLGQQILFDPMH